MRQAFIVWTAEQRRLETLQTQKACSAHKIAEQEERIMGLNAQLQEMQEMQEKQKQQEAANEAMDKKNAEQIEKIAEQEERIVGLNAQLQEMQTKEAGEAVDRTAAQELANDASEVFQPHLSALS